MPRLSESLVPVPLIEAKDYGSAGVDADGVNLGLLKRLHGGVHVRDRDR
jgi:hypothetical protein